MRTSARRLGKLRQKHGNLNRVVEAVVTVAAVEVVQVVVLGLMGNVLLGKVQRKVLTLA